MGILAKPRKLDRVHFLALSIVAAAISIYCVLFLQQINRELVGDELAELAGGISIQDWRAPVLHTGFEDYRHAQVTRVPGLQGYAYYKDDHPPLLHYVIDFGVHVLKWPRPSSIRWIGFVSGLLALGCSFLLVLCLNHPHEYSWLYASLAVFLLSIHPLFIQAGCCITPDSLLLFMFPLFFLLYLKLRTSNHLLLTAVYFLLMCVVFSTKLTTPLGMLLIILLDTVLTRNVKAFRLFLVTVAALLLTGWWWWYYWQMRGVAYPNLIQRLIFSGGDALGFRQRQFSWLTLLIKQPALGAGIIPGWFGFGLLLFYIAAFTDGLSRWFRQRRWATTDNLFALTSLVIFFHIGKYNHFYPRYQEVVVSLMVVVTVCYLQSRKFLETFDRRYFWLVGVFVLLQLFAEFFFVGRDPLFDPSSRAHALTGVILGNDSDPFDTENMLIFRSLHFLSWLLPFGVVFLARAMFFRREKTDSEIFLTTLILLSQIIFSTHASVAQALANYNTNGYYLTPVVRNDELLVKSAKEIIREHSNRKLFYVSDFTLGSYLYFSDFKWKDFILPKVFDRQHVSINWSGEKLPEFSGLIFERNAKFKEGKDKFSEIYTLK